MNDTTKPALTPTAPSAGWVDADEECEDQGCYLCGGMGFIVTCIDDLCRGAGECMHGDGELPCPACCAEPPNATGSATPEDAR